AAVLLLAAFPLLALWFAARAPHVAAPAVPFSRDFVADSAATLRVGTVTGFPAPAARGWSFPFREAGGERLAYRVNLETPGAAPDWGAAIALTGRASPAPPPPNPGQLDMRRVLRGQGAAAVLEATAWREVRPPAWWRR